MSESEEGKDAKAGIRLAVDNATVKRPRVKSEKKTGGGPPPPYSPPPPDFLPDDAPVKALGTKGEMCYFLDSIGQLIARKASELGRLNIIKLFGNEFYLKKTWPERDQHGNLKNRWNHAVLAGILIDACTKKGLWDPYDNVRGPGTWEEPDGTLVMHCGDLIYANEDRAGTGLRGSLLYPRGPRTLEPRFNAGAAPDGPAAILFKKAQSWNWARGDIDAKLFVGLIGCQLLGAAATWRAQCWVTGPSAAGKSTLQLLIRWLHGPHGMVMAENATPAGIGQAVGYSSLPVSLDELEAKANNSQVQETIELMRIAASGGGRLRGGSDGQPTKTQLFNCFIASSVLMPPLKPQDKSRMAVLTLRKHERRGREPGEDELAAIVTDEDIDEHIVLGKRESWERVGCGLRGRLIEQWGRYKRTFRAFRGALIAVGHGDRAADQFGAIGAAYDCLMFDGFDEMRAFSWGEMLPRSILDEAAEAASEERQCLNHLLEALPDIFRSGAKQTVAYWITTARDEILDGKKGEANETLEKLGLRVYRGAVSYDAAQASKKVGEVIDTDRYQFYLDVSHTASPLQKIYAGTHWQGQAGAVGTWAQALRRLKGALFGHDRRRWIGKVQHQATTLPFESVFPPKEKGEEDDIALPDRIR